MHHIIICFEGEKHILRVTFVWFDFLWSSQRGTIPRKAGGGGGKEREQLLGGERGGPYHTMAMAEDGFFALISLLLFSYSKIVFPRQSKRRRKISYCFLHPVEARNLLCNVIEHFLLLLPFIGSRRRRYWRCHDADGR